MSTSPRPLPISPYALAAITTGTFALALLTLAVPHSSGYGHTREPLIHWLTTYWASPDWQHCALAIPAMIGVAFFERKRIASLPIQPAWTGLLVLAFGATLFVLGYRANIYYLGYGGLQFLFAGMLLWFGGWRFAFGMTFYILFFTFLWPLVFLEGTIGLKLRMLMVASVWHFLEAVGVSTIRHGTALFSAPDPAAGLAQGDLFRLDVEGPCSGLRSLFALTMVGALFAYITTRSLWRQILLFLSSFPLAVAGNFVRMLILLVGVRTFGSEFAIGTYSEDEGEKASAYHFFAGIAVFVVALLGLVGLAKLLKVNPRSRAKNRSRQVSRQLPAKP
jgi:exosortase